MASKNATLSVKQTRRTISRKDLRREELGFFLAGFVEGEGSLIISVVKFDKAPYGVLLQPEFNITQHISGIDILKSFKILFNNKGQIHKKSGSNNV